MSIFQAIIYGIVQGITEFLPVSSTAHLDLMPWIFGWQEPGNVFDVAAGALVGEISDSSVSARRSAFPAFRIILGLYGDYCGSSAESGMETDRS